MSSLVSLLESLARLPKAKYPVLTGIAPEKLNFLHRSAGRVCVACIWIHSIGHWTKTGGFSIATWHETISQWVCQGYINRFVLLTKGLGRHWSYRFQFPVCVLHSRDTETLVRVFPRRAHMFRGAGHRGLHHALARHGHLALGTSSLVHRND